LLDVSRIITGKLALGNATGRSGAGDRGGSDLGGARRLWSKDIEIVATLHRDAGPGCRRSHTACSKLCESSHPRAEIHAAAGKWKSFSIVSTRKWKFESQR
jgi:hypothetical protein